MRRVVTVAPMRMEVQLCEPPVPGPGEALVRIDAIGLCGSDYHLLDGTHPYAHFPQVQGHELAGTVAQPPAGYDGPLAAGDRVAVEPLIWCGVCLACRRGRGNCCAHLQVMGAHAPGGLADYITVPVTRLHATGDLPAVTAALIEPMSIALHAVTRAGSAAGDRVLVIGAGPIGLLAAVCAADRGATVMIADREPSRLAIAASMGVPVTVDTSVQSLPDSVAGFTDGEGVSAVVEATGVPSLVRMAVDVVAHSGTIVVVGISTDEVAIPVSEFSRKELSVLGSRNSSGEFPAAVDMVARHADVAARVVTDVRLLDQAPEVLPYARAHPAEVGKVVLTTAPGSRRARPPIGSAPQRT